jgi:hypothetical protein
MRPTRISRATALAALAWCGAAAAQDAGDDRFKLLHQAEKQSEQQAQPDAAKPAAPAPPAAPTDAAPPPPAAATQPAPSAPPAAASAAPAPAPAQAAPAVAAAPPPKPRPAMSEADMLTRKYNAAVFNKPKKAPPPKHQ